MPGKPRTLTDVPLSLEGDVGIDRARRYQTHSFAAHDVIVATLTATGLAS